MKRVALSSRQRILKTLLQRRHARRAEVGAVAPELFALRALGVGHRGVEVEEGEAGLWVGGKGLGDAACGGLWQRDGGLAECEVRVGQRRWPTRVSSISGRRREGKGMCVVEQWSMAVRLGAVMWCCVAIYGTVMHSNALFVKGNRL